MKKRNKIIYIILLSFIFISTTLAYIPTEQDNNTLNSFYEKIDYLNNKSPEKLDKLLNKLEKYNTYNKDNEQLNYLIKKSINYINSKINSKNKIITREEAEKKYKWDLTKIYNNTEEIEKDFKKLEDLIPKLSSYKGKLGDEKKLLEFLKLYDQYNIYSDKIRKYISLSQSINPTDKNIAILDEKDTKIYSQFSEAVSFFIVELKEFDDEKINSLIKNPIFSNYKNSFIELQKQKKHILTEKEESIINKISNNTISFSDIYYDLINIDIKYPKITDPNGNEILTNYANIYSSWESKDKNFRKEFTENLYNSYKQYEYTLANLFIGHKKLKTIHKKLENYNSVLESRYEDYDLSEDIYDNLINTTKDNLDIFHKYVKLKKDYLGLDEIHYHDIMTPLEEVQGSYTYEEAKDIIISSLYKLGEKYIEDLKQMLGDNMVDVYSGENKEGGAFSSYSYLVEPHILYNFNNTLGDVKTLAHEAGHSVNFYNIINNQPINYSSPTFPVEVPSTTNEIILIRELANKAKTDEEKLAYLDMYMVTLSTNYWRASMYGDFEKQIYNKIWNNEPVTLDVLNTTIEKLFKQYYGPELTYDDFLSIEWAMKHHFFRSYYTHEYAISIAISNTIGANIYNQEPGFTEKYLEYLKTGTSELPNDALKKLEIDLTKKDYLEKNIETQKEILIEMEEIINRIKN